MNESTRRDWRLRMRVRAGHVAITHRPPGGDRCGAPLQLRGALLSRRRPEGGGWPLRASGRDRVDRLGHPVRRPGPPAGADGSDVHPRLFRYRRQAGKHATFQRSWPTLTLNGPRLGFAVAPPVDRSLPSRVARRSSRARSPKNTGPMPRLDAWQIAPKRRTNALPSRSQPRGLEQGRGRPPRAPFRSRP
jgi:hypothetical protein